MVATTTFIPHSALGLVLPMTLYMAGIGLTMPQALAGALQPFPHHAGTASSLAGFVQQTVAAAAGALVGHLLATNAWPLVAVVAVGGCLTFVAWWTTRGERGAR
jgi:DHA1 family bicyclomycin/chloramphenicol resistance-like MFS transporter